MPITGKVYALGYTKTKAICEITVSCPNCKHQETYTPTMTDVESWADALTVHNNAERKMDWTRAKTGKLLCPKCKFPCEFQMAIHKSGAILIANPEYKILENWWQIGEDE